MAGFLKNLWNDENGAAAAEYVLILGLAALAIIAGAKYLGGAMNDSFTKAGDTIKAP